MVMGRGGLWALCGLLVGVVVCSSGQQARGAQVTGRHVLGVVSVQGEVWNQATMPDAGRETRVPGSGGALLEGTRIRTGTNGVALLTFSKEGVVGLRANTTAEVTALGTEGPGIQLASGEALVQLPPGSRLTLSTPTATVRAEPLQPAAAGPVRAQEASIRITPEGQTIVRVENGSLRVESRQGVMTVVRAGEEATLAPDSAPRIVAVAGGTPATPAAAPATAAKAASAGHTTILGLDPMVAGLAAVGVTAGGLGGAAASGAFGGGGGGSNSTAGEGSPFKPHPPHPQPPPGQCPGGPHNCP